MPIRHPSRALIATLLLFALPLLAEEKGHSSQTKNLPNADPSAVRTAISANVEIVADGLNFPTLVDLDDEGNVWIGLSGTGHGNPNAKPAVLKVAGDGKTKTVIDDGLVAPLNDLL